MTIGAILTLGLGTPFSDAKHLVTLGYGTGAQPAPPTPTPTPTPPPAAFSGGYLPSGRRRTREELRRDRERFGIQTEVQEAIEAVAEQVIVEAPKRQSLARLLEHELTLRGLEWDRRYAEVLRKRIAEERMRQQEEDDLALLLAALH